MRNKKILAQANKRARKKALCLALEIKAESKNINIKSLDYSTVSIGIEFLPII